MMSDKRVCNLLVLNSSLKAGEELAGWLTIPDIEFKTEYTVSLEHYEKSLLNGEWDLMLALVVEDPTISLQQALTFRSSARQYLSIPFIIIAPDAGTHTRIQWMQQGASDVVEESQYEHLLLVISRELNRSSILSSKKESHSGSVKQGFDLAVENNDKDDKAFLMVEVQGWAGISQPLDEAGQRLIEATLLKEVGRHLGDGARCEITDDGVIYALVDQAIGHLETIAGSICRGFDQLFIDLADNSFQVGVAVACSALRYSSGHWDQLIEQGRELLKEAGDKGLNKYAVYCPDIALEKQATEGDAHALVQHALDNQSFRLMFQPIASLRGDTEEHYDVLLRVIDPEGREVSAGQFMGPIDKTELAEKIDKWVILQSIKRLLQHRKQETVSHLFLHLSGATIQDKKFLPWLFLLLKKTGVNADALVFQLGEENVARYQQQATHTLQGIEKIGCRTSLCHFGSTINPMGIAKGFSTDYVKLAGKLTLELAENPDREKPVREMIEALQTMGRKTIVPSIESPNVMTRVWRTGSDYVQGFFLQKPKPDMDYDFSSDE